MLSVDGKELARKTIPHTIPFLMTVDETFDVGVDTRTGVDDSYQTAVPLYRHDQQADLQTRAAAADGQDTKVGKEMAADWRLNDCGPRA